MIQIPYRVRPMHVYIPGKTRHGKSTLIHRMALQDIVKGNGVCVMDAKGDLVKNLLATIPESRADDTILLDIETPVPLDFMGYQSEAEKEALIGELKYILTRSVEPEHAPLMNANLTDVLYTLLNFNENPAIRQDHKATFIDIYNFLEVEMRQKEIIAGLTDPTLIHRWTKQEFPRPIERSRITSRMTPFVRSPSLRTIFGAPNPTLNISEVMDNRKVLLVDLGGSSESQKAYGTLLISKIRQAAFRRAKVPPANRTPFYLYCDEFQEFQTSDFDKILSMAGGFGLCLSLANQFVDQLEPQILHSILGNVSTFIIFRLGEKSANAFRGELPKDKSSSGQTFLDQITTLPIGRVVYRDASGHTQIITTDPPIKLPQANYSEYIRKRTVEKYACNTQPGWLTEISSSHDDDIPPTSGAPSIPPYKGKAKNLRTTR